MTISTRKSVLASLTAVSVAVVLAGCGSAPVAGPSASGSAGGAVAGFLPCIVSDDGGWNDKSFNQSAKVGMDKAAAELGVKPIEVESSSANDYAPNLENLVAQGCTFIVSVGFKLSADTVASAKANPKINYAIIDDRADNEGKTGPDGKPTGDGKTDAPNIKPLLFDTVQAAYLGGYAAAAWSDAAGVNKVGTFGGLQIPPVTIFMDGFVEGVKKFNTDKGKNVQSFGWDVAGQSGAFTGGFAANDTAKQTAQGILDQGVNVVLPVGGPIYLSASAAIKDSGKSTVMLGVDSDLAVADPSVASQVLVSIMKRIDTAVHDAVTAAGAGKFDPTIYVGTLANQGVGLSPFHDFESKLPAGLTGELAALQKSIIDGSLKVTSPSSP